jgi:hypothetical protein
MGAASYIGFKDGLVSWLWTADQTHITILMLALFVILTAFIGWMTLTSNSHSEVRAQYIDFCWFGSDALMRLGIITTVLGFVLMFNGKMHGLDLSNAQNVKDLVVQISQGLTTALTGTLVGVVTSMLTGAQLKNYEVGLAEDTFFR